MSLPSLREALERDGLWAKKSLGQHFLLDLNLTGRIAKLAGPLEGRPVIEIGPGPGGLTRALLEAGASPVIAVEKDARFISLLQEVVAWSAGRLHLVEADALAVDEAALLVDAGVEGPATIVSNLPYNVGTPLLIKWLRARWSAPMTLMFQKEVAQRIVARPGEDAYGRLAVLAQSCMTARIALTVPAQAFTPPPKVASAVVRLDPIATPFEDLDALERVTAAAFGQRRKMLRSSLSSLGEADDLLDQAGLDGRRRAEEIEVANFQALARLWRARR